MERAPIRDAYESAWRRFVADTREVNARLGKLEGDDATTDLHALLAQLHPIPYVEAHQLLVDDAGNVAATNIGSITGLFFEQTAASLIKGYMSRHVPEAVVLRNRHGVSALRSIARDPDVSVTLGTRSAIFEVKSSPKKRDIAGVRALATAYAKQSTPYFLIAGYVSLSRPDLELLARDSTACVVGVSPRNEHLLPRFPSFDALLARAEASLHGA